MTRVLILRVRSVAKALPGGRQLFDGLGLTLGAGEHVAIHGESGAGKSTLLNIVAGLDTADSGRSWSPGRSGGLDEAGRTALRRDAIGFVFQAFHILPHLTSTRTSPCRWCSSAAARCGHRTRRRDARRRRPGRATASYPRELSGGELQRVAIARALVHRPGCCWPTSRPAISIPTPRRDLELFGRTCAARRGDAAGHAFAMPRHGRPALMLTPQDW